jgi:hypothetical protein
MLDLESPRWAELQHAYGAAADIPALLRRLQALPSSEANEEPWFSIWDSLAHQGDVYSASFAAVPYVVEALASAPNRASATYFHFPAWVEVCRQNRGVAIPQDLDASYFSALARLPALAGAASVHPWDADFTASVLAAIAAAKGNAKVAEAVMELTPEVAEKFLVWSLEQ